MVIVVIRAGSVTAARVRQRGIPEFRPASPSNPPGLEGNGMGGTRPREWDSPSPWAIFYDSIDALLLGLITEDVEHHGEIAQILLPPL